MPSQTVILSETALDIRLTQKCARRIVADQICCADNPAVKALPEFEREVWILHCNGVMGREIADMLGTRKDIISRLLAAIRAKFRYLADFRSVLESHPAWKSKFYAISE